MKRLLISAILIALGLISYSQSKHSNQIDLSGSIFRNNVFRYRTMDGGGHTENGDGFRFGLQYSKLITDKIWFNTGFGYLKASNVWHGDFIGPFSPQLSGSQETFIISIPVRMRLDLLNWLYFKTGLTIDFQTNNKAGNYVDNQSGVGFSLVGGIDLKVSKSIHFNIEPELGITSLIYFDRKKSQQHFLLTGINFNIGYRF
ncbi:MAG: outer membrane beta-barrel protein [Bacteroidales bacterium]|jgi:hypothetical protein|nr:outer membrane beta-barrel protein [Bacteroidales bacterium]